MNSLETITVVNLSRSIKISLLTSILFFSSSLVADCVGLAKTESEAIYCEIVSRGEGSSLPGFEDFKRNDPVIQLLLLKRPAAKLKIELPSRQQRSSIGTPTVKRKNDDPITPKGADVTDRGTGAMSQMGACSINNRAINCGGHIFQLMTNQSNHNLNINALSSGNRLDLPEYEGKEGNSIEEQYYLKQAYSSYISKMLDIGLGASTMSYTRFYHTFYDLQAKSVSFSGRFETMFSYLKKDKSSMSVSPLLSSSKPNKLTGCDQINHNTIVCDTGGFNWVYVNLTYVN